MDDVGTSAASLRERTRTTMRDEVAAVAIRLFALRGFDAVTTAQIAAEAGISPRSFFRYFATKEDVVLGSLVDSGIRVRESLIARPAGEVAWEALRQALRVLIEDPVYPVDDVETIARIILETPSIRARDMEKYQQWEDLLAPHLAERLAATGDSNPVGVEDRARAMVGAACSCLRVATDRWLRAPGAEDPTLIFDALLESIRT
jgi:AcrR family transcriptional regulator